MSLLGTLLIFGKEVLPFLKETLLEGQSLRAWLRDNWLTFFSLVATLLLTMMVAHLSDLVHNARDRELALRDQINALAEPTRDLIFIQRQYRHQLKALEIENEALREMTIESAQVIEEQIEWMRGCGMNVDNGSCPATPRQRRPRNRPPPVTAVEELEPQEQERRGFLERLRGILNRSRREEED